MHFLDWLDRHFASNCHYYYADDLGCPLDLFTDPKPRTDAKAESAQAKSPNAPEQPGPDTAILQ